MNQKESATSNPSPNTRENENQKAEEPGRAEISRAVSEARAASVEVRRIRDEQERIASEEIRLIAKEYHAAAEDLRAATEEAKEVLEKARKKKGEGTDFDTTPEDKGKVFAFLMEQMPGYLAARFIGVAAPGEGARQNESIAEHCRLTNSDKLLIDVTGFEIIKPYLADKFIVGERLGTFTRYGIKVAFVCGPKLIDPAKFAVLLAQNCGVNVETFTDFQAAEEWLLK